MQVLIVSHLLLFIDIYNLLKWDKTLLHKNYISEKFVLLKFILTKESWKKM